jgi:flagellar motility protein MotE (MotC chaperone)
MQATQIQIEQANDQSFIAQLHSAARDILADTNGQDDKALQVVELIEDGKLLEAVMVDLTF